MTSQRRLSPDAWLWLVPLAVTLAAAWAGWALGGDQRLDVGAGSDGPYVSGFYDREEQAGVSYRWSKTDAEVRLPAVRAPAVLDIRMAGRPGGVPVALVVDGRRLPEFQAAPLELRRYRVLLGPAAHRADTTALVLGAQAEETPQDGRRLAVLLDSVVARPLGGELDAPPLASALALVGAALALWAALRLIGVAASPAALTASAAGLGLAVSWELDRLYVGPYLPGVALGALAAAALVAGLRSGERGRPLDGAGALACVAAAAGVIPLALALAGEDRWAGPAAAMAALLPLGLVLAAAPARARPIVAGLALAAAALGALGAMAVILRETDVGTTFHGIHRAASRLWFGTLPLYNTAATGANPFASTFSAPPAVAALLLPLVTQPYAAALLAWRIVGAILALAAGALLLRAYRAPLGSWPAAGALLLLLTLGPLERALDDGRITPLLMLLLAAGLLALSRGRHLALGACLGAAAALQPPLLLLLGFPLVARRWRALAGAAAAFAGVTLAAVLVAGLPAHLVYLDQIAPALSASTPWVENQSLQGFVHRLFSPEQIALRPDGIPTARAAAYALAGAALLLTAWLTRPGGLRADLGYGLWVAAALLAAPVTWASDHALLIVPIVTLLAAAAGPAADSASAGRPPAAGLAWPAAACMALGYGLLAWADARELYDGQLRGSFWQLLLSAQVYGAVLLYTALALAGRAAARRRAPAR